MNDEELQRRLARLVPPPASESTRERARQRALLTFREADRARDQVVPSFFRWGPMAAAAALVLLAAMLWPRTSKPEREPDFARVLAEMESLFPGQLDAVIEQSGELQFAVTAKAHGAADQPLVVEFRRGDATIRVLSYSGRRVCVDLGGHRACFEPLLTEQGQVIVAGEDFVWSAGAPATTAGWTISAAALPRSS